MPRVTVLEDEYVSLWYYPETKIVHHMMHRYLVPGVFRKLKCAEAELMEKHGATKLISDDHAAPAVAPEDIQWAEEEWFPRVKRAGFRHWAIVVPPGAPAVTAMQLKKLQTQRRGQGITVEPFDTAEAALAWLESL